MRSHLWYMCNRTYGAFSLHLWCDCITPMVRFHYTIGVFAIASM